MEIKNSEEFIEVLRTINCMGYNEFVDLFGKSLGGHICSKRGTNDKGIKFLFELDDSVLNVLYNYSITKISDRQFNHRHELTPEQLIASDCELPAKVVEFILENSAELESNSVDKVVVFETKDKFIVKYFGEHGQLKVVETKNEKEL